jgi:dolichol kinase
MMMKDSQKNRMKNAPPMSQEEKNKSRLILLLLMGYCLAGLFINRIASDPTFKVIIGVIWLMGIVIFVYFMKRFRVENLNLHHDKEVNLESERDKLLSGLLRLAIYVLLVLLFLHPPAMLVSMVHSIFK